MCSLCNSSYMVIENRVHAFTYIHSYFSSRFSASKIACGDITFITGISVNFNSLISHLVCFGLALDVSKGGKNHYWNDILVDCCIWHISYWEKSLLKYCAHWLLYNFDFADSDLSLYIVHIVPFVCCIIHVLSILLVDCCMTYIILVCPVYDRHHVANGWLIVASFNLCIHFDCCIISSLVHLSNPRSTKSKQ